MLLFIDFTSVSIVSNLRQFSRHLTSQAASCADNRLSISATVALAMLFVKPVF
jgi:hypothetical protein